MKKTSLYFWLDITLFAVLGITILAATVEIFLHFFVHVLLGLLLSAGALTHVALHWDWIRSSFNRLERLPAQVRTNFWLNLALFGAYTACGLMGLSARTLWLIFPPMHFVLGAVHVVLAIGVLTLQTVHLVRHWKWITATARRMFSLPAG